MRVTEVVSLLQGSASVLPRVSVLSGAGISVGAGIPDFRSRGGMYDTLRPELLTATPGQRRMMQNDPTAVVSFELFRVNQYPYLEVRRPFILGTAERTWRPTLSHFFLRVLHEKGMLQRIYTQNIDGLDYQLGLPEEKVIPVHGSIGTVSCEACGAPEGMAYFRDAVKGNIKDIYNIDASAPKESTPVQCRQCGQPALKPSTVLYGRSLPAHFFKSAPKDMAATDVMLIIGTSLTVQPAASLPDQLPPLSAKVLVNRDQVGGREFDAERANAQNVHLPGDCDDALLQLTVALGWLDDLLAFRPLMCERSQLLLGAYTTTRMDTDTCTDAGTPQ